MRELEKLLAASFDLIFSIGLVGCLLIGVHVLLHVGLDLEAIERLLNVGTCCIVLVKLSEHRHGEKGSLILLIVIVLHLSVDDESILVAELFQLVQSLLNEYVIRVPENLVTLIVGLNTIIANDGNQEDHELL